jgi:hypothetical protein
VAAPHVSDSGACASSPQTGIAAVTTLAQRVLRQELLHRRCANICSAAELFVFDSVEDFEPRGTWRPT